MNSCDFAVLERLDVNDVIDSYLRLYAQGRHGAPPDPITYQWIHERGPRWVRAVVPLDYLDFQDEESSGEPRIARARQYAKRGTHFPPGTASYGAHSQRRHTGKAFVKDGNHRTLAAHFRGDCSIEMFMQEDEFAALVEDATSTAPGSGRVSEVLRDRTALILMHVDSIGAYRFERGLDPEGIERRMLEAIRTHKGPLIVVNQGWGEGDEFVEAAERRDGYIIKFDELESTWPPFLKKLNRLLKELGVTNVRLGGFWYRPDQTSGCATKVLLYLRSRGYTVNPDQTILGCEPW